jgi:dienelactone hydrolase
MLMAELVLFHHAQGLTAGCLAFADDLRAVGHVVHTPDLYDGRTFTALAEGVDYAKQIGFGTIIERGRAAAERLPKEIVYAGFSLGVLPAQCLAQTRAGTKGALLFHAAIPLSEFGGHWPRGVPLQIHTMEGDALGDVEIARELVKTIKGAQLFLYPGNRHLFTDNSLPDYDASAATLLKQRVLSFLAAIG